MRVAIAIFAAVTGLAGSGAARADIYGLVDANGGIHLSDRAQHAGYRLILREPVASPTAGKRGSPSRAPLSAAARPFHSEVLRASREQGVDPALLHAVITAESAYDPGAVSPKGARGLMQIMPATAQRYGVAPAQLASTSTNLRVGARYLADLLRLFEGDLPLAIAAYNAGEQAVVQHGRQIPPYAETQAYVPRVLNSYKILKRVR